MPSLGSTASKTKGRGNGKVFLDTVPKTAVLIRHLVSPSDGIAR
jgi:hypothetical protein